MEARNDETRLDALSRVKAEQGPGAAAHVHHQDLGRGAIGSSVDHVEQVVGRIVGNFTRCEV